MAGRGPTVTEASFVQALALGLDPAWRRLPEAERCADARAFEQALQVPGVTTHCYAMIGLRAGADLLLWRLSPTLEQLEEAAPAVLRTGIGAWVLVRESRLGLIQPSQHVSKRTVQEQSHFSGVMS